MVEEEWSLKEKDVDMVRVTDDKEDTFGYPAYPLDMLYSAKDIETLRQKLIEDFIGFVDYIGENPEDFADATKKHIEIINKRFGVKHG